MKANELRIGNLVFEEFNNIAKIQSIEYDEISEDMLIYYNKYIDCCFIKDDCKPIPLTEEWLVKFGFKKTSESWGNTFQKVIKGYNINWNKRNGIHLGKQMAEYCFSYYKHIKYVHQLQNLYFALTSKELMI